MSSNSVCNELPLGELILLARHASRILGYISLKALSEYFPSLDMKTNLLILENLLSSRHIKRARRGYYAFVELAGNIETTELKEESRALADAKRIVLERVRVNLPPNVLQNGCSYTDENAKVDPHNRTAQGRDSLQHGVAGMIQNPPPPDDKDPQKSGLNESRSIYAEERQNTAVQGGAVDAGNLGSDHQSTFKGDGFHNFIDPGTVSGNPSFPSETRRSAQGLKRKLDAARAVRSLAQSTTSNPSPDSSHAPAATVPESPNPSGTSSYPSENVFADASSSSQESVQADTAAFDLASSMAALQLHATGEAQGLASENGAADLESTTGKNQSELSALALNPSAPEFTPISFSPGSPTESSAEKNQENPDPNASKEAPRAPESSPISPSPGTPEGSSIVQRQELPDSDSSVISTRAPRKRVDLLPPPPKPRPVPSPSSVTPSKAPERDASKFHWTKKKTGDEVEDPCEALELFCSHNDLKSPAYSVLFMPGEEVYYSLVIVGKSTFKSYPTLSLTRKRSMEVAAEKAVSTLGITASMVARFREAETRSRDVTPGN